MKAVRIHEFGGVDVCRIDEVASPRPQPGEVVVRVEAAAISQADLDVRAGRRRPPVALPHVMGFDASGTIEQVGPGVQDWVPGDRVVPCAQISCERCAACRSGRASLCPARRSVQGAFAEWMRCPASHLVRLPDGVDTAGAAAVPTSFGTSWHMLFTRGRLTVGETVLVSSVGGGIGAAAIQLAAMTGARVIGTATSDDTLALAARIGMHHGINVREQDVAAEVRRLTDGDGVDLVVDHTGADGFQRGLDSLRPGGRMVTCGVHPGDIVPLDVISLFRTEHSIIGSLGSTRQEIERCLGLVAADRLHPVVHATYALDAVRDAMRELEDRCTFGQILLTPS